MSDWTERILKEFPTEISRFWIASDPDGVLLDERVLATLRERGFEVLLFEDSIAFRVEYEERYRTEWEGGAKSRSDALILHLRSADAGSLPWDYLRIGRQIRLGLSDLFPDLSYGVVSQLGSEHYEPLFAAQQKHSPQALGETAAKEFVLTHVFKLSPHLIERPEELWRELLRLYSRSDGLPSNLAGHMAHVLGGDDSFSSFDIHKLFTSRAFFIETVQQSWEVYVIDKTTGGIRDVSQFGSLGRIPFEHPDVRAYVDGMFVDGLLRPVHTDADWVSSTNQFGAGVAVGSRRESERIADGLDRICTDLPAPDALHGEWLSVARRLGDAIARRHAMPLEDAEILTQQMHATRQRVDEGLREWVGLHFGDLPSLPVAKAPAMVHHAPRHMALRRNVSADRVALLVFDGLAVDQWVTIRNAVSRRDRTLRFDEGACFAWLPTLTSVSRQALFSGQRPREFTDSIDNTAREPQLWSKFWQDQGLRANEVFYRKGVQKVAHLADLRAAVSNPAFKAVGVVVDTVDEIVHGAVLGKRGIANQIEGWCETGFVEQLFGMLLDEGFQIFVTADHGNVEAVGVGRPNQGAGAETKGERVRIYRSEVLAASVPSDLQAFRLDIPGLPADYLPLFAPTGGAFTQKGAAIVAHGGPSIEELIVPFIGVHRVIQQP
jgi:hypothetical protein